MSAAPAQPQDDAPASVPQTPPPAIGYGHPEYHFVQGMMEVQKSLGEIKASIDNLKGTVDGVKTKVEDLVNWKHRIIGGVAVLSVIFTLTGIFIGKFWDYFTIKAPPQQLQQAPAQQPQPPKAP